MKPIQPQYVINALIQQRNDAQNQAADLAGLCGTLSEENAALTKELEAVKARLAELEKAKEPEDKAEDKPQPKKAA